MDFAFETWHEGWVAAPLYLYRHALASRSSIQRRTGRHLRHDNRSAFGLLGVLATALLRNQCIIDTTVGEYFAAW